MKSCPMQFVAGLAAMAFLGGCVVKSSDEAAGEPQPGDDGGTDTGVTPVEDPCEGVPLNGMCADTHTTRLCMMNEDGTVRIVTNDCGTDRECVEDAVAGARCQALGECIEGESRCSANEESLETCEGAGKESHWVATSCDPDNGGHCVLPMSGEGPECSFLNSAPGQGFRLHGTVKFQRREANSARTGWGDLTLADATDMSVTIYDGSELIGLALTGYDIDTGQYTYDGQFTAYLSKPPTANTSIWLWPMAFNYDTGRPLMAVAKAVTADSFDNARTADQYWAFGYNGTLDADTSDIGEWVITEAEGSGALNVFRWVDYGMLRTAGVVPGYKQDSLIVYWSPAVYPDCGACYCPPGCGGGGVRYGQGENDVDRYDTWIILGGTNDGHKEWAAATISHELGHWSMQNYSLSPNEGGPHSIGSRINPAFAYSEGWATSFSLTNIGTPIYLTQAHGSVWWLDVSKWQLDDGQGFLMPDPNGPIDQPLDENVVAGMLMKMWTTPDIDPDGQSIGDQAMFAAFTNPQLIDGTYNRGYKKIDLVDFLDVGICSGALPTASVTTITQKAGYPYNAADAVCQ